jgi:sphinganine-1-phosphate aldolase
MLHVGKSILRFRYRSTHHHLFRHHFPARLLLVQLRAFQFFVAPEWSGGIYACPSMPGSRPGGLIAATWAALVRMGEDGYLKCAREIMSTSKEIETGVRAIKGLRVLGKPDMSVIAITGDETLQVRGQTINIYKVAESLGNKKKNADGSIRYSWNLNSLQKPAAIHICVTYMHRGKGQSFLDDLQAAVDDVADHPDNFKNGSAAVYGMAESLPDGSIVSEIARGYLDAVYTI